MRTALTSYAANKLDASDSAITDYLNLSSQAKLEVAEIALQARDGAYADTAALLLALGDDNTAAGSALEAHKTILDAVNGEDADIRY